MNIAEKTDQFDVVLDLASSTLSDGSTVEAMRLARGVQAMEAYLNKQCARIVELEEVMQQISNFSPVCLQECSSYNNQVCDCPPGLARKILEQSA